MILTGFVWTLLQFRPQLYEKTPQLLSGLKPNFALIGEVLFGDYNLIVNDDMLHSCTNYECYKGLFSSLNDMNLFEIAHSLHRQFGADPWCIYRGKHLMTFADNHDVTRLASILKNKTTYPYCIWYFTWNAGHSLPVLRQ